MKLFYSPVSPYVRKIMIVAFEAGLERRIEQVPVSLSPYAPNADVVSLNPLGKIPVLTTDDGMVLYDSTVIAEYLASKGDNTTLFPPDERARLEALTLSALADGMLEAAQLVRFERARPEGFCFPDWLDAQHLKITRALALLEKSPPAAFNIGAVALCSTLSWIDLRLPDLDWQGSSPRLAAWFVSIASRQSVIETQPPAPVAG